MTELTEIYPAATGYKSWPEPGEPCLSCGQGTIQQRAGSRICDYCGKMRFSMNCKLFMHLKEGEVFYSADDRTGMLLVKIRPVEYWGANPVNALDQASRSKHSFGSYAAVIVPELREV